MKFVIIDDELGSSKQKVELLNKDIDSGSHVFLLIYLTGCPPCNMTKPEWDMLEKEFPDNNLVVARINSDLLSGLKNYGGSPKGYPTMRYICKKGSKIIIEEYDGERTKDAFIKWIKSHIGVTRHVGGSRRRKKMASRHSRKSKSRSQSKRHSIRHSRKSKSKRHSIRHSRKSRSKRHRRIARGIKEDIENLRKKRPELFKEFESKLPNDIPPEIELNFKDEVSPLTDSALSYTDNAIDNAIDYSLSPLTEEE